jgi:hypothetical protein
MSVDFLIGQLRDMARAGKPATLEPHWLDEAADLVAAERAARERAEAELFEWRAGRYGHADAVAARERDAAPPPAGFRYRCDGCGAVATFPGPLPGNPIAVSCPVKLLPDDRPCRGLMRPVAPPPAAPDHMEPATFDGARSGHRARKAARMAKTLPPAAPRVQVCDACGASSEGSGRMLAHGVNGKMCPGTMRDIAPPPAAPEGGG